jgi:hypothetical protein
MEVLIVIGGIVVAIILIVTLLPLFIGICVVAFLAWLVSNTTGLSFWGAAVLFAVLAAVGYVVLTLLDQ